MTSLYKHTLGCCAPWEYLWSRFISIYRSILTSSATIRTFAGFKKQLQAGKITLTQAFFISATREASAPRDHIYAIQGLLKKDAAFLKPCHQTSTPEVYSSATKMLFFKATGLDILVYAVGTRGSNAHGLASRVCDWSRTPLPSATRTYLFNASNGRKFRTKQTADRILTVVACKVDMICTTAITMDEDGSLHNRLECLKAWWSLAEISKCNEKSTIWTTILGGLFKEAEGTRRILPEDLVNVEAWWKLAASSVEKGDYSDQVPLKYQKMWNTDAYMSFILDRCRFWLTSQGFFGRGRETIEKGDEVFIVKGSPVPLILRPIEGARLSQLGLPEREQGYLFVSECYLHGFMDGEAVKPDTKWERVHLC